MVTTDLVGRDAELRVLADQATRVATGVFRCVLITGDAGVGKSGLADTFARSLGPRVLALRARGYPLGATSSFGLWAEALEGHLRWQPPDAVGSLCGGYVDDLSVLLRAAAAVRGGPPASRPSRMQLLEALTVVLARLAERRTVVLVLDDLHLADTSSLDALDYLSRNLEAAAVLVLATAHSGQLSTNKAALQTLHSCEQRDALTRVRLDPLPRGALTEFAARRLGVAPVPEQLVSWLWEQSHGNPLFADGLLRALVAEGADLAAPALRRVPEGLRERVVVRLAECDDIALSVVETLAVLGRRVNLDDLAHHIDVPLDTLAAVVTGLVGTGLVAEHGEERVPHYEVAHPLLQEAVYEQMGSAKRQARHRRAGRALAAVGRVGEAAPHFVRSAPRGDPEAVSALRAALAEAEQRGSYREAFAILEGVVSVLPSGDPRWVEILDALDSRAEWVPDHRADTEATVGLRALREIEKVVGDATSPLRRAALHLRKGVFLTATGEPGGHQACMQASDLFRAAGDPTWARIAAVEASWACAWAGDQAGHVSLVQQVLAEAEDAEDRLAQTYALHAAGYGHFYAARMTQAERAFSRAVELALADGRSQWVAGERIPLAETQAFTSGVDQALRTLALAAQADREAADVELEYRVVIHLLAGDHRSSVEAAEALVGRGDLSPRRAFTLMPAVLAHLEMGSTTRARALLGTAQRSVAGVAITWGSGLARWAMGQLAYREERLEESFEMLVELSSWLRRERLPLLDCLVAPLLAEVAVMAGRAHEAMGPVTELEGHLHGSGGPALDSCLLLARARLHLVTTARTEAKREARDAAAGFGRVGWRGYEAQALTVLGEALAAHDRQGAVVALRRAAETHDACAATWRRDRALRRLHQLGHSGRRASGAIAGPRSLTEREREVALLACDGLTAREIGDRLFLGRRTIETHLANTYAKLGVTSKRELIRRRHEFGLTD